ncbi:GNAT family N-acetyltransferase [Brevibacterium sp. 'Marine']|uniref:GNAT family N-acetyltransferase n=1 Tax=Brevibacterium sp. 'Marine' TaxID=2725563 RepID=UPI00145CC9F5|nr:GNAT family N-acetyltransferase [Brevibacterium sp. 'Marine']
MVHDGGICTARLRLRPWRVSDAAFHRRLWEERDKQVPARRRISADGRPTQVDLEEWIRTYDSTPEPGLLVVDNKLTEAPMGYCGLVDNSVGHPDEPELAFEFLQECWGRGFATEASRAVVERAEHIGYRYLASTVREWNSASFNVLGKLGFEFAGEREPDSIHGDSLLLRLALR